MSVTQKDGVWKKINRASRRLALPPSANLAKDLRVGRPLSVPDYFLKV